MDDLKPDDLARPFVETAAMQGESINFGFTAQQDAAIRLRVPNSGVGWLDAMIREARRLDMATAAMQGILTQPKTLVQLGWECKSLAQQSADIAGAILARLDGAMPAPQPGAGSEGGEG